MHKFLFFNNYIGDFSVQTCTMLSRLEIFCWDKAYFIFSNLYLISFDEHIDGLVHYLIQLVSRSADSSGRAV
jgi:hypothetical protein